MRDIVKDFIDEIQKDFPNETVDINNVNDFYIVREDKKNCANCKGLDECKNASRGFYMDKNGNQFVQAACPYLKKYQELQTNSVIKSVYSLADFNSDLSTVDANTNSRIKIVEFINNFLENYQNQFCKGLYLYGRYSIGKTYVLSALAMELKRRNTNFIFAYFPDLVVELKNGMATDRYYKIIDALKETDVLILDDFGAENVTSWLRDEVIGPIINYRITADKPLFISSNIGPKDLSNHLVLNASEEEMVKAGRIVSRLNSLVISVSMDDTEKYAR
ncbi:MAG: ATP-binding protein [Acholeplasmatales bacterium]|nr:ATP-binding protein [Acholeplasmatales bacterium]